MGIYVYSIVNEDKNRSFGNIGLHNCEVVAMPYKNIAAVVSATEIINFDSFEKEKLTAYVEVHQKVNEALLKEYDVVPMTFGMIAEDEEDLIRMFERCYLQFEVALKKIVGKIEFAVQVFWDRERILHEIVNAHPEIQELKDKASKGGIAGMPAKIKLGKLLYEKAEFERKSYIEHVAVCLKDLSHDSTYNKLIDDSMIVNLSCLIDKSQESELDRVMMQLGEQYGGKLRFKYIGPMPPYSFTSINFSTGNFELIDEARKILRLGKRATFGDIKRAYHALAQKYHPDRHGGSNETAQEMKKINDAYALLEVCCQSFDQLRGKDEDRAYSFREADIKNLIIVS